MAAEMPGPWVRRPISVGLLLILGVAVPVALPPLLVVSLIIDLVTRSPRMPKTRAVLLVAFLILADLAGFLLVSIVWLLSPFGLRTAADTDQRRYTWVMTWWTTTLMRVICTAVPLPIDRSELDESLLDGNAVVIGRHRSLLDAVLPAMIFGKHGLRTLYVLKEDLRWDPNIDIVGHRMAHRFITRAPTDLDAELGSIRELAGRIDDRAVGVIFPEGTFFTEQRKADVVASLEQRDPDQADAARRMNFLLPPRPAGTLALLDGAPDADVIVFGHVGFEPYGSISRILKGTGAQHHVRIKVWRYRRSEIPADDDGRVDWLFDRWAELDDWIAAQHPLGVRGSSTQ